MSRRNDPALKNTVHCWKPQLLTATAEAVPSTVVVVVIAVLVALAGIHGLKFSEILLPATDEFSSNTREPVMVLATVIGPTAAVPPVADTLRPQMYVVLPATAASVPTTAPVVPVALPVIGVEPDGN